MKLIHKFKSPNFDSRKLSSIRFIIIHYTAISNYIKALNHLSDKKKKVSSHYLINQSGQIYSLVDENHRAWHAGVAYWDSNIDINSLSIGIELDYSNKKPNNKFSKKMMISLKFLIKIIMKKYKIKNYNVLGHSDISPFRKKDPGVNFPWHSLSSSNLSFKPFNKIPINVILIEKWFKIRGFKTKKKYSNFYTYIFGL